LSSADALEALLNSIIKDNQTFTKKLEEKKGKKVVQFEIKNVDISKQKLKDF
jgi:ubiquinone biosynthesis protein UbiJ